MKPLLPKALLLACLFSYGVLALAADASPSNQDVCIYVVKKGDTLSEILIRLGITPQYGPSGTIAELANQNEVARNGDLIFPDVRIRIPRNMIAKGEVCLSGQQENDVARRISLYSQAEAQMQKTRYADLCKKMVEASTSEIEPARKGRLLHFAAVCEYQEHNFDLAYRHWQQVLQLEPDTSLIYRANYNLALLECQTDQAAKGYERLRQITPALWQEQTESDRRAFLDLAAYCSEKGSGLPAKLDILISVLKESESDELRTYAAEKLQTEFSDSSRCDQSKLAFDKIPPTERHLQKLELVWNQACGGGSVLDTHVQISGGPTFINFNTGSAIYQWVGLNARLEFDFYLDSGWAWSAAFNSYLATLGRSGTALDVRALNVGLGFGRVVPIFADLILQTDFLLTQSSLLTSDRNIGYYDLISYGLRIQLRATEKDRDWLKGSFSAALTNSDTAALSSNFIVTVGADHLPSFFKPFYWGAKASYTKVQWGGVNQANLEAGLHVGASW